MTEADNAFKPTMAICPVCGHSSSVWKWNEVTETAFGRGFEPILPNDLDGTLLGFEYKCPHCGAEVNGVEIRKEDWNIYNIYSL